MRNLRRINRFSNSVGLKSYNRHPKFLNFRLFLFLLKILPNRRGFKEERELVNRLEKLGFAVLRAPASGSGTKSDRPDILAGRKGLYIALEVKTTSRRILYVNSESLDQLVRFSDKFGANPYIAVKFKRSGRGWLLLKPGDLEKSCKRYKITLEEACRRGIPPELLLSSKLEEFGEV